MAKKIMIVDDEPTLVELVTAILKQKGFDVIPAYNGKECLEKLEKVKPDLILMDMMMPGMSGRETTKKIRANPKTKNPSPSPVIPNITVAARRLKPPQIPRIIPPRITPTPKDASSQPN